ncbi:hypothetical protein KKC13_09920 [bacterium]|nr:hypothetical protein [bacterium]MBU1956953.1 hypothetical protein [bacterium]
MKTTLLSVITSCFLFFITYISLDDEPIVKKETVSSQVDRVSKDMKIEDTEMLEEHEELVENQKLRTNVEKVNRNIEDNLDKEEIETIGKNMTLNDIENVNLEDKERMIDDMLYYEGKRNHN